VNALDKNMPKYVKPKNYEHEFVQGIASLLQERDPEVWDRLSAYEKAQKPLSVEEHRALMQRLDAFLNEVHHFERLVDRAGFKISLRALMRSGSSI